MKTYNRIEAKLLAKQQIQGNILTLFLIQLIVMAIAGACGGIPVVGWVATFVIIPPIEVGVILIYLNMAKGERPDIGRMFDGFQNIGPCVILYLSFIGWALLAIPTLGLIYIWLFPYMKMATANFYNAIKPQVQNMGDASEY